MVFTDNNAGSFLECDASNKREIVENLLSLDKYKADMDGVFSTSVNQSTLDESPDAYKDPAMIEEAIGPTAVILDRVKPVLGMKDSKGEEEGA